MIKRNIIIFHGTGGNPKGNWFPWLKKELVKKGCQVFIPKFPTPEEQSLKSWLNILKDYDKYINNETILIGHSLGGLFLLRVLERLDQPIYAAFFISAPVGVKPILYYESDFKFSGYNFDWKKIKSNANNLFAFHSDNDPYICLDNGKKLAKEIGIELNIIPQAGHLNAESGYTKFDRLLKEINRII